MEEQKRSDKIRENEPKQQPDPFQPQGPRDGLDNTGTQGYDSLKGDGYTGADQSPKEGNNLDGTAGTVTPCEKE